MLVNIVDHLLIWQWPVRSNHLYDADHMATSLFNQAYPPPLFRRRVSHFPYFCPVHDLADPGLVDDQRFFDFQLGSSAHSSRHFRLISLAFRLKEGSQPDSPLSIRGFLYVTTLDPYVGVH